MVHVQIYSYTKGVATILSLTAASNTAETESRIEQERENVLS